MSLKSIILIPAAIIAGGCLAIYLVFGGWPRSIKLATDPARSLGPLEMAIEYDASDTKFESLVKAHPELINIPADIDDPFTMPILVICSKLYRTNYVRILIEHGADVPEAEAWLERYGPESALQLLRETARASDNSDSGSSLDRETGGVRDDY